MLTTRQTGLTPRVKNIKTTMQTVLEKVSAPILPSDVVMFDATSLGNYGPRGWNPSTPSGSVRGLPIPTLTAETSRWLVPPERGSQVFTFFNADGKELGRAILSAYQTSPLSFYPTKP